MVGTVASYEGLAMTLAELTTVILASCKSLHECELEGTIVSGTAFIFDVAESEVSPIFIAHFEEGGKTFVHEAAEGLAMQIVEHTKFLCVNAQQLAGRRDESQ